MPRKFPPPSPEFIPARNTGGSQRPRAIVLHGTVSSDNRGTARNIALWWNGPNSPASSCHYVVDPGKVIQCVGDHTVAWHCGYNQDSVGVEFCDEQQGPASRWDDKDSRAILRRAARLVAELCLAYGIEAKRSSVKALKAKGPHGIYGHNDSRLAFGGTTHTDPRDFPWGKFMRMVRREIRKMRRAARRKEVATRRTFSVLHAPLHGASATKREIRRALRRKGNVSVAFSEAWRQSAWLGRQSKWRMTTGGTRNKDSRGRQVERDVVLMTRRYRKKIASGTERVANASKPLKIAPERHLSYSIDNVHGRPLAVIAMHPHAAVRNAWDSDRAREYRKSMRRLHRLVVTLRETHGADLDIVIMGDLQYPDLNGDNKVWTPRYLFERLGMSWASKGIDWVAWSSGLRVEDVKVISKDANGQDHPWIEVELSRG